MLPDMHDGRAFIGLSFCHDVMINHTDNLKQVIDLLIHGMVNVQWEQPAAINL